MRKLLAALLITCLLAVPVHSAEEPQGETIHVTESESTEETIRAAAESPSVVVLSDHIDKSYEAEEIIHDDGKYVLTYESEEDAHEAFDELSDNYECFVNETIDASALTTMEDYPSLDWGYGYMNFDNGLGHEGDLTVAILDSGVCRQHPLFEDQGRILQGYDFGNSDEDCEDQMGHGTGMTGIVYGCTPSNVKILPVKIWGDDGTTTYLQIRLGLEWALEQGADVINMSFSTKSYSMATGEMIPLNYLDSAMDEAYAKNIVMVASAGNDRYYITKHYPACSDKTITISATDENDQICDFSNWGKAIDFSAPGANVFMASPDGGYLNANGTSISAPHAAAAFARLKLEHPDSTISELYEYAKDYSIDFGEPGWDDQYGWGCIVFGERVLHSAEPEFTKATYTGERITQSAKTKVYAFINGRIIPIKRNKDYKVTYEHNTTVGTASMIMYGTGNCGGQIVKTFKIVPQPTTLLSVTSTSTGKIKASWKSQRKKTTGYQIQYSTDKNFLSDVSKKNVSDNTVLEKTIGGLTSGKNYYVRIRTYKKKEDGTYYSDWSKATKVKVK